MFPKSGGHVLRRVYAASTGTDLQVKAQGSRGWGWGGLCSSEQASGPLLKRTHSAVLY